LINTIFTNNIASITNHFQPDQLWWRKYIFGHATSNLMAGCQMRNPFPFPSHTQNIQHFSHWKIKFQSWNIYFQSSMITNNNSFFE
jgi:hypothetical protein